MKVRHIGLALALSAALGTAHAAIPASTRLTLEATPAGIDTRWPTRAAWELATTGLNFAHIPDWIVDNGTTAVFNIRAPYLTDTVGGATLTANCSSALPTGGFDDTADGLIVTTSTTTDMTCTWTATRAPFIAISNSHIVRSAGDPDDDVYDSTIPIGLTCTTGVVAQIPCTVSPPRDPRAGTSWSGINYLEYSVGGVATGTIPALPGLQFTFTDSQIGVDPASTTFTGTDPDVVIEAGGDVDLTTDIVAFRNTPVTGDFVATVKVNSITSSSNYNKCGLMVRESLADNAAMLVGHVQKSAAAPLDVQLRGRNVTGANVGGLYGAQISAVPYWVRIARTSGTFYEYGSTDGNAFTALANTAASYNFASTVYVGPYGTGSGATEVNCDLDNFTLTQDPALSFTVNVPESSPTAKSIAVRAYDLAGTPNVSDYGTAVSATAAATSDVTPPTISVQPVCDDNDSTNSYTCTVGTWNETIRDYTPYTYTGETCAAGLVIGDTQVGTSYTRTGLSSNTLYSQRFLATDLAGNPSALSNCIAVTTAASPTAPSAPPENVTAVPSPANPTIHMLITWEPPATGACDHYILRHRFSASDPHYVDPAEISGLSYTSTGNGVLTFAPNNSYLFSVGCSDAARENVFWSDDEVGTTGQVSVGTIQHNPGHYVEQASVIDNANNRAQITERLALPSAWKGVCSFVKWGHLEGARGDYSKGDAYLDWYFAQANAAGKKVIITFDDKVYGGWSPSDLAAGNILPIYLTTDAEFANPSDPAGNDGLYVPSPFGSGGLSVVARFWTAPVMDREIALLQHLGARYNSNPALEGIIYSSLSIGGSATQNAQMQLSVSGIITQVKRWGEAARAAFPNKMVGIKADWSYSMANALNLVAWGRAYNISWSDYDTYDFNGRPWQGIGTEAYAGTPTSGYETYGAAALRGAAVNAGSGNPYAASGSPTSPGAAGVDMRGKTGHIPHVESPDYQLGRYANNEVEEFVDVAKFNKATHMCWTKYDWEPTEPDWDPPNQVNPWLNLIRPLIEGNPTIGIHTAYPTDWP